MSDIRAEDEQKPERPPFLSDSVYKNLEWIARVLLPATATLYGALGALWGFPNVTAVVGTIVVVDTFLGVLLGFAQKSYDNSNAKYSGEVLYTTDVDGTKQVSLSLDEHPEELVKKPEVRLKVVEM